MRTVIAFVLFSLVLSGCNRFDKPRVVEVDGLYSLTVAPGLSPRTDLNDEASLQYGNLLKELYVICIHETKTLFAEAMIEHELDEIYPMNLDGFSELLLDAMLDEFEPLTEVGLRDISVNGHKGKKAMFDAKNEDVSVHFQIAYLEGKEHFYQIWTWTLLDRKEKYMEQMDDMIASFIEM